MVAPHSLLMLLCLAVSKAAFASDMDFTIYRNGEKVGSYAFTIAEAGRTRHVHSTMHIAVKRLGLTVYQASHERREVWAANRLLSLKGRSLYNGKSYDIELHRDADSASLEVNGVRQPLGPDFFTFVPWLIEREKSAQLITEKGRLIAMSAVDAGLAPLPRENGNAAFRHRVYRSEQPREAWYDRDGALVRMTYTHNNAEILLSRDTPEK